MISYAVNPPARHNAPASRVGEVAIVNTHLHDRPNATGGQEYVVRPVWASRMRLEGKASQPKTLLRVDVDDHDILRWRVVHDDRVVCGRGARVTAAADCGLSAQGDPLCDGQSCGPVCCPARDLDGIALLGLPNRSANIRERNTLRLDNRRVHLVEDSQQDTYYERSMYAGEHLFS